MIKTLIFDFGGVIVTLDQQQAIDRFRALGLADAEQRLDTYTQAGIFGELESGHISAEAFRASLSDLVGHNVTYDECCYAWQGYRRELPARNVVKLQQLRQRGYRIIMLSNTNPFMMAWAESAGFYDGKPVSHYFDALYLSYQVGVMKPDERFFRHVIEAEALQPGECLFVDDGSRNVEAAARLGLHTFCPVNGSDWTTAIESLLSET